MTVDQFIAVAARLKATVEQRSVDSSIDTPNPKPEFKRSAPYGGCSLQHCRCSPGLWTSFFSKGQIAIAHFGTDYERGGAGLFDEDDFDRWRTLCTKMIEHRVVEV